MRESCNERDLENVLTDNITGVLLELSITPFYTLSNCPVFGEHRSPMRYSISRKLMFSEMLNSR